MPMGRPRKNNKHLPRRVYFEHGRYWFKPKKPPEPPPNWKPRIDLGTDLAGMYDALSKLVDTTKPLFTMGQVFDRFLVECLPKLAPRTQTDYRIYIQNLRKVYDAAPPDEITAGDLFEYRAKRAQTSVTQANREMSCMSSVFREAIGWREALGRHAVKVNPCHELKRLKEVARDRYVEDPEFTALYGIATPVNQVMMDLTTITSQREGDLLTLPLYDPQVYTDEGIVFRPGKSKRCYLCNGKLIEKSKVVVVRWLSEAEEDTGVRKEASELWRVVERARKLGPDIRKTLICRLDGKPYSTSGFQSNWTRLMKTAVKGNKRKDGSWIQEPVLKEPFTFHDLRAKSGSDEEDLMVAFERMAHDDPATTQRIYRRKPRRARAGRKVGT